MCLRFGNSQYIAKQNKKKTAEYRRKEKQRRKEFYLKFPFDCIHMFDIIRFHINSGVHAWIYLELYVKWQTHTHTYRKRDKIVAQMKALWICVCLRAYGDDINHKNRLDLNVMNGKCAKWGQLLGSWYLLKYIGFNIFSSLHSLAYQVICFSLSFSSRRWDSFCSIYVNTSFVNAFRTKIGHFFAVLLL